MEWEVPSCVATLHCTWRKDWKGRRRADDDRAAAARLDQLARLATYRRKKFTRALAREEWIQRRLKMTSRIRRAAAKRNWVDTFSPGLAASATLVRDSLNPNRKAVAPILIRRGNGATALRLRIEQGCLAQKKVEILIHTRLQPGDRKSRE